MPLRSPVAVVPIPSIDSCVDVGNGFFAGGGYRKALEFLVKDYAIKLRPADAELIKKTDLGPCIQTYVSNQMVKDTAQWAAWLGNDEVHYLRKWEDHDLHDLKELIQLVLTTIQSELIYSKMMFLMWLRAVRGAHFAERI